MPDEPEEEVQPEAVATGEGEAESTVIEPGGTDNSTDLESNTDESTNILVSVEAPEAAPATDTHCEHCEAHAAELAELREGLALVTGATAVLVSGEVAEEEEVIEAPPPVEETAIEGEGTAEEEGTGDSERHAGVWL